MKATVMYGVGDVRVEAVPDPQIRLSTDVIVRITRSCICGSDLWPYKEMPIDAPPRRMGHEFIGIVDDVGADVRTVKKGDRVIAPFAISDGSCDFCLEGLHTSCVHGQWWGGVHNDGGQGEAVRVPMADGTLFKVAGDHDEAQLASLLTLSDVMGTGHHAALCARVSAGKTAVVVGDGAVGLCGVIAARRLGAERIMLIGRHPNRISLARDFGATDIVRARGAEAIEEIRAMTGGVGAHAVLECVGSRDAMETALRIARPGGAIGRVGVPHYDGIPETHQNFYDNVMVAGGPAPVRGYIETLLPDVLAGRIQPGRVFDAVTNLDGVPEGYRQMNDREAIKVLIKAD